MGGAFGDQRRASKGQDGHVDVNMSAYQGFEGDESSVTSCPVT